jgi:hypothetical protein
MLAGHDKRTFVSDLEMVNRGGTERLNNMLPVIPYSTFPDIARPPSRPTGASSLANLRTQGTLICRDRNQIWRQVYSVGVDYPDPDCHCYNSNA